MLTWTFPSIWFDKVICVIKIKLTILDWVIQWQFLSVLKWKTNGQIDALHSMPNEKLCNFVSTILTLSVFMLKGSGNDNIRRHLSIMHEAKTNWKRNTTHWRAKNWWLVLTWKSFIGKLFCLSRFCCNHKKENVFVSVSNEMLLCLWQYYRMQWGKCHSRNRYYRLKWNAVSYSFIGCNAADNRKIVILTHIAPGTISAHFTVTEYHKQQQQLLVLRLIALSNCRCWVEQVQPQARKCF